MKKEKLIRYLLFLIGLFINSFGVSFITKASLGTSPISSIPYVLSLNLPLSLGQFTILFNLLIVALQILILRKNFKPEYFLQIPVTVLFGYFIDLTMEMLSFIQPTTYLWSIFYLLIGCLILGFGVYMEVLANVVMLPGESFVRAITFVWKTEFGTTKIIFDCSMTVIAILLSFLLAHRLDGVREGTVIAALFVGFIARQFGRLLKFLPELLFPASKETAATTRPDTFTITIGRQYGCGARDIGQQLAKKLGFSYYDEEIIQKAANTIGKTPAYITGKEENMTNSFLYDLVHQSYAYHAKDQAPQDEVFSAEADAIKELSSEENCVIIGRCSDAILREQPNCFRVWLYAPDDFRTKRIMKAEQISEAQALQKLIHQDKHRSNFYHYFTGQMWGLASNYHISLDTSLGFEYAAEMLIHAFEEWKKTSSAQKPTEN